MDRVLLAAICWPTNWTSCFKLIEFEQHKWDSGTLWRVSERASGITTVWASPDHVVISGLFCFCNLMGDLLCIQHHNYNIPEKKIKLYWKSLQWHHAYSQWWWQKMHLFGMPSLFITIPHKASHVRYSDLLFEIKMNSALFTWNFISHA